ncbi:MFS transporter [Marinicauda sp. Alg238-R41]|uniref:MFS transporter n=1 Tax=Marinicauda sp. Alg238-R41 TaxID=2993447 RepID=UPI0022E4E12F|nr:MFS transporter [Marinicauda sp. Alg238-R41]
MKARSLALIALCQVLALSSWFAGAAALPALQAATDLDAFTRAALSSSVQIGFVAGALVSASLGLSDRFDPRRVFAAGAGLAALTTLAIILTPPGSLAMAGLRLLTGASLALVYPVGMKLAASWAKGDAGLLIGLLVGALTLGSALPHLFALDGADVNWRTPFVWAAALAGLSAVLIGFCQAGPAFVRARAFDPRAFVLAIRRADLRYANLGYLGHMWELYAFWAWAGAFLLAYFQARSLSASAIGSLTFLIIASGALGALGAGWLADRIGRTPVAAGAMLISGACALLTGLAWPLGPGVMIALLLVYGVSVIADSAQFSAAIAELAPRDQAGSLLTLQTALGFALTAVSVQALPYWVGVTGWQFAFAPLAIGPAIGVWAMLRLRGHPNARQLAGGRG